MEDPTEISHQTKGIRQGDPLSPYLFVICTEVLVRMLQQSKGRGKITGLKVARSASPISHLLFADDSMFYCKESDEEVDNLVDILESYYLVSRQRINYQKSNVYFGKNVPEEMRSQVKQRLKME